ncbi:tryptophan synthase subunit alpha [Streptomyces sp. NPDC056178]
MHRPSPSTTALQAQLHRQSASLAVFLPAGLTDRAPERRTIDDLADSGLDVFEVGVPHRSPVLDGPTISAAYQQALARGTFVHDVLGTVSYAAMRAPVVVMTYWDPVALYGPRRFARDMMSAGAAGIMVVDLPRAQTRTWTNTLAEAGLTAPRLVPADTVDDDLAELCATASGWLYTPAATAPTGYQGALDLPRLARSVQRLRKASALPVVSGVGISTPDYARAVAPLVNGVVVGSPVVRALTSASLEAAASLVADFAAAVHTPTAEASCG